MQSKVPVCRLAVSAAPPGTRCKMKGNLWLESAKGAAATHTHTHTAHVHIPVCAHTQRKGAEEVQALNSSVLYKKWGQKWNFLQHGILVLLTPSSFSFHSAFCNIRLPVTTGGEEKNKKQKNKGLNWVIAAPPGNTNRGISASPTPSRLGAFPSQPI